jgi:hypothetical protein
MSLGVDEEEVRDGSIHCVLDTIPLLVDLLDDDLGIAKS